MNNRWFYLLIASVVLMLNIYPLYQLVSTKGYLFYINAYDETSYLQYDFSLAAQNPARIVQYLVTLGHELGLSGGRLNLIFDLAALPTFMFFTSRCFYYAGFDRKTSNLYALLLTILPLAFCRYNPLVYEIVIWSRETGALQWITSPDANFLPLVRTPEPQFSLAMLSIVVCWSLKKNSFLYLYPVLPFLYPFVGVPAAFIVVALHLNQLLSKEAYRWILSLSISYLLLSVSIGVYCHYIISESNQELLVATRLPLVSITALECLVIALWGYQRCEPKFRFLLVVLTATPLAVTNLQIISGWLGTPHSYEQNFSILCVSCVLLLSIGPLKWEDSIAKENKFPLKGRLNFRSLAGFPKFFFRPRQLRWVLFAFCMGLVLLSGGHWFRINDISNSRLTLTKDVLDSFHEKSERVVINNLQLAAVTNMIFPRQPSTLLGYERSYALVCTDEGVRDYLLAKKSILQDEAIADQFRETFATLDDAYRYEGLDYYLLHNGRKKTFHTRHDTSIVPEENETREFITMLIDNEKKPPRTRRMILNWMKTCLSGTEKPTTR